MPHLATLRGQITHQQAQQSGLAGAIRADDAHLVAALDGGGKMADNDLIPVGIADIFGFDHQSARTAVLLDLHLDLAGLLAPLPPQIAQALEGPHPAFIAGAARLDPLPDPLLLLGQFFIKGGVLLLFRR